MTSSPILACNNWPTNAHLIEDVAKLGYLKRSDLTLDSTYGKGVWWRRWRPKVLFDHDLAIDGHDFRDLPYEDETFDAVAFDPPYVSIGGRETTKIKKFYDQYGLRGAPTSPEALQMLINDGLTEQWRLVKTGGIVIVKAMSYVSSGKLYFGDYHTLQHALWLRFKIEDRFIMHGRPRQQPPRTRKDGKKSKQQHARNNASVLFVLRKAI